MRLFSFLLFYKAFGFLAAALVSSCSPEINVGNLVYISLSNISDWRFNINNALPFAGAKIITFNSGDQPDNNEIFMLSQPINNIYEIRPFNDFSRTKLIGIPADTFNTVGAVFEINFSTSGNNQRFIIACDFCNLNANATNWVKYHTSCSIKNSASNLCANGIGIVANVTQIDCAAASKWDFFGMLSPDVPTTLLSSYNSPMVENSTGVVSTSVVSTNVFVAAVLASIIVTALLSFTIGYWFIKHRKLSKNEQFIKNDPVNNQVINI